jgi:hypothetical protein
MHPLTGPTHPTNQKNAVMADRMADQCIGTAHDDMNEDEDAEDIHDGAAAAGGRGVTGANSPDKMPQLMGRMAVSSIPVTGGVKPAARVSDSTAMDVDQGAAAGKSLHSLVFLSDFVPP